MVLFIIIVICLVALFVYGNKLRRGAHRQSLDAYAGDLSKGADATLDETLMRAKEVALENGIDINK